jgi:hypothetical protein
MLDDVLWIDLLAAELTRRITALARLAGHPRRRERAYAQGSTGELIVQDARCDGDPCRSAAAAMGRIIWPGSGGAAQSY